MKNSYSPSNLYQAIRDQLNKGQSIEWMESEEQLLQYETALRPIFLKTTVTNLEIYITSPCNDADNEKDYQLAGGLKISRAIAEINKEHKAGCAMRIFIPLAQTRTMFYGLVSRSHWTLLVIDVNKDNVAEVKNYNSEPYYKSFWYGLDHVKEEIAKSFPGSTFESIDLGHQPITDFINCGRWITKYLCGLLVGKDPKEMNTDNINKEFAELEKFPTLAKYSVAGSDDSYKYRRQYSPTQRKNASATIRNL